MRVCGLSPTPHSPKPNKVVRSAIKLSDRASTAVRLGLPLYLESPMDVHEFLKYYFSQKKPQPRIYPPGWTPERIEAARQQCLANKPWLKSTGPRTPEGKLASSMNSFRHGRRSKVMIDINKLVREAEKWR